MSTFYFEHNITQRQNELSSKVVEAVRYQGNCTRENIPQLTKLRDAFKDNNKIGLIDHSPILDIIAFDDGYSDVFNEDNISLLLQVLKTILPGITTIQYSKFGGENKRLFSATPEELAKLAQLKEQEEQERKEREQKAKEQEIEESLIRSRIPQNLWDKYTFKDFNVTDIDNTRSNKEAYRLARQFTSINFSDDKISDEEVEQLQADRHNLLTFIGAPGTGKTRLALTIGIYLIRNDGESVRYWQVQELFETLKGTFNKSQLRHNFNDWNDDEGDDKYNKILTSLKSCRTLILDDLGAENGTPWTDAILDMIIDYRYSHEMQTIITSNVDISKLSPRIASRLSEGNVCKILMPDFRKVKALQREKKNRKVTS